MAGQCQPSPSKNSQSLSPAISNSLPINFSLNGWPSATERTPPSLSPQNSAMACKSLSYKPLFCTSLQPFSPLAMAKHSLSIADSPPASSTTSLLSLALSPTFSAELGNSSYQCPNALVTSGIPHHEKGPWYPSRRNMLGCLLLPFLGQKGLYPQAGLRCHSLQLSSFLDFLNLRPPQVRFLLFVSWLPPFSLFCPNEARIWIATHSQTPVAMLLLLCCCCQGLAVGLPSWEGAPGTTFGLNPGHQIVGGLSYISG